MDGEDADAGLRTLSIQLKDARSGQLQIALQGQMNRDTDRTLLKLQPPAVRSATKSTSELAVWLDAASESAGLESGSDWTVKSAAAVSASFDELSASPASLAFQSNAVQPGMLTVKLREAVSTLIGESVTVTNVTETAIEVTDARVPASVIAHLIAVGQDMLAHPVEVLPGAAQTLAALAGRARLVLITKGDLLDQERKLAQSGLGDHFDAVEIVSEKTAATYARVFAGQGGRAMMVGNSLRSDVIPALAAGAWGVHVPHPLTWAHEQAESPAPHPRFHTIPDLRALPDLWSELNAILP